MKRFGTILLAAVMLLAAAAPALASDRINVKEITYYAFGDYLGNAAIDPEKTKPGDEILIPLLGGQGFKDANGDDIIWDPAEAAMGPTVNQIKSNQIKVRLLQGKNTSVIRDIDIVSFTPTRRIRARAAIRVRFVEDLISTEEITYEFRISLALGGEETYMRETFGGMIRNETIEIDGNDYVELDGAIADCRRSTDHIQVNIGNGLSIHSDMIANEKYYGIAKLEGNRAQDPVLAQYEEIQHVFTVSTVNLKTHGNVADFSVFAGNQLYYVYNRLGEYLGTSSERLPYSTRYYLSPQRILIDIDPELLSDLPGESFPMSKELTRFIQGGQSATPAE